VRAHERHRRLAIEAVQAKACLNRSVSEFETRLGLAAGPSNANVQPAQKAQHRRLGSSLLGQVALRSAGLAVAKSSSGSSNIRAD
jgi:hypothetical protein